MKLDFGWGSISLLPSAPYSIHDECRLYVFGLAFERQQGVHAVGGGPRQDFDRGLGNWPSPLPMWRCFRNRRMVASTWSCTFDVSLLASNSSCR